MPFTRVPVAARASAGSPRTAHACPASSKPEPQVEVVRRVVDVDREPGLLAAGLAQRAQRARDEVRAQAAAAPRRHDPDLVDPVVGERDEADRRAVARSSTTREARRAGSPRPRPHLADPHVARRCRGSPGRSANDSRYAAWNSAGGVRRSTATACRPSGRLTLGMSTSGWRMTCSAKVRRRPELGEEARPTPARSSRRRPAAGRRPSAPGTTATSSLAEPLPARRRVDRARWPCGARRRRGTPTRRRRGRRSRRGRRCRCRTGRAGAASARPRAAGSPPSASRHRRARCAQGREVGLRERLPGQGRHASASATRGAQRRADHGTWSGSRARVAANEARDAGSPRRCRALAVVDAHLDVGREDRDEQRGRRVAGRSPGGRHEEPCRAQQLGDAGDVDQGAAVGQQPCGTMPSKTSGRTRCTTPEVASSAASPATSRLRCGGRRGHAPSNHPAQSSTVENSPTSRNPMCS